MWMLRRRTKAALSLALIGTLVVAGCRHRCRAGNGIFQPGRYSALTNLLELDAGVYSGAEPADDAAFRDLERLGVRTIVSVDGALPKVGLAKAHGMRYVHVPIGYDAVPEAAALALTRVMREADGPVYFHCHHGRHRGPAAAAIACIAAGLKDHDGAEEILVKAGTSKAYAGLWRDVAAFEKPALDVPLPELVETAEVADFAAAMAAADRAYDALKLCLEAGWRTPPTHPDLSPEQQALLLWEGMRESRRHAPADGDTRLEQWLAEAEALTAGLRRALAKADNAAATQYLTKIRISCRQCHQAYRND